MPLLKRVVKSKQRGLYSMTKPDWSADELEFLARCVENKMMPKAISRLMLNRSLCAIRCKIEQFKMRAPPQRRKSQFIGFMCCEDMEALLLQRSSELGITKGELIRRLIEKGLDNGLDREWITRAPDSMGVPSSIRDRERSFDPASVDVGQQDGCGAP